MCNYSQSCHYKNVGEKAGEKVFFRKVVTKKGGKEYTYLKLIENYREGGKIRQRVIANFGNLESITPELAEGLIAGLTRILEVGPPKEGYVDEKVKESYLNQIKELREAWKKMQLNDLILEGTGNSEAALLTEVMALARLIDPESRVAVSRMYEDLYFPELSCRELNGVEFYEVVETLGKIKDGLGRHLLNIFQEKAGRDLEVLFILLSSSFEGNCCEISASGHAYHVRPYIYPVEIGLVVTMEGVPFTARVLIGKNFKPETISNYLNQLTEKYRFKKCITVDVREENDWPDATGGGSVQGDHMYLLDSKKIEQHPLLVKKIEEVIGKCSQLINNMGVGDICYKDLSYNFCLLSLPDFGTAVLRDNALFEWQMTAAFKEDRKSVV